MNPPQGRGSIILQSLETNVFRTMCIIYGMMRKFNQALLCGFHILVSTIRIRTPEKIDTGAFFSLLKKKGKKRSIGIKSSNGSEQPEAAVRIRPS